MTISLGVHWRISCFLDIAVNVVRLQQKFIIKQIIAEFFDRPDDSETFLFRGTVLYLVLIKFL